MKYTSSYYERIGEENINNQGEYMKIIEYTTCDNIKVMFKETGNVITSTYSHFKNGSIKDKRFNNANENKCSYIGNTTMKDKDGNIKKSYSVWRGMLKRCRGNCFKEKQSSYQNCYVCDDWLCYENFEKWYNDNYYEVDSEQMCVDKDILIKNNKVYSPDTCMIVPERINSMFKHRRIDKKSSYPIGVTYVEDKKLFVSEVKSGNKRITTYHKTPDSAFYAYKIKKEECIKQVADEYKDKIPKKLYDAMYKYKIEITD